MSAMDGTPADRLLEGLDDSQRRAVVEPARPLAILAPAGSGKTRVLTRRIAWQSATEAIDPAHVLALTFTRKAAGELRNRLRRLGVREQLTAGTFHAVALAQLRAWHEHHGTQMAEVLDRKARLLGPLVKGPGGPARTLAINEVAGEIEWAQARLCGPNAYVALAGRVGRDPSLPLEQIADVYRRYQAEKRRRGLIDFDDLVRLTAQSLEDDHEFAATQRWRFRHLFVDEFQDVSRAQLRLLQAWLGTRDDLCVVGDPDQAIYSFAGADSRYLTAFADHFPGFPVLPGVLMLEAMVQAGRRLLADRAGNQRLVLGAVRGVKYGTFVRPGHVMRVEVSLRKPADGGAFELEGEARVLTPGRDQPGEPPVAVAGRFTLRPARTSP